MGWDAYAEPVERLYEWKDGRSGLRDPEQEAEFAVAVARAEDGLRAAGLTGDDAVVDGLLRSAGLDCRACGDELARATGADVYPEGPRKERWDWSPDDVRRLAATAKWESPDDPGILWAHLSAREFLNTCAALGLGIRFSW